MCFQHIDAVLKLNPNTFLPARIPQKDPLRESVLLPAASLQRITSKSRFINKDREALKQAYWKEKEEKAVCI